MFWIFQGLSRNVKVSSALVILSLLCATCASARDYIQEFISDSPPPSPFWWETDDAEKNLTGERNDVKIENSSALDSDPIVLEGGALVESGVASWDGDPSSSGMRAAHPKLRIGTFARVTNALTGQSAVVEIDRRLTGAHSIAIELSRDASAAVGVLHEGVQTVLIEIITPTPYVTIGTHYNPNAGVERVYSSHPPTLANYASIELATWDGDSVSAGLTAAHPLIHPGSFVNFVNVGLNLSVTALVTRRSVGDHGLVLLSRDAANRLGILHDGASKLLVLNLGADELWLKDNGQASSRVQKVEVSVGSDVRMAPPILEYFAARFERETSNRVVYYAPSRVPVRSVDDGTVEYVSDTLEGMGSVVVISHGEGMKSLYARLDDASVELGDFVLKEQSIGRVLGDDTKEIGEFQFMLFRGSVAVDPTKFVLNQN